MHSEALLLWPHWVNDYNHVQFDGAASQQHFILIHADINHENKQCGM